MPVSAARMYIAAAADANIARRIADQWVGERPWLFVVGEALANDPDRDRLIAAAMRLMARDDLSVVRLDGAELPLGFRDLDIRDVARELAGNDMPPAGGPFSGIVDLHSTIAPDTDDDVMLDALRVRRSQAPRSSVWKWAFAAILLVVAIGISSMWMLAGEADPNAAPAQAEGPGGFIGGMLVTLALGAAAWGLYRLLRRRRIRSVGDASAPLPLRSVNDSKAIFISYSHRDSGIAHELAGEIERQGRSAWIFEQQMQGGATGWAAQVVRALRESKAVMLVGSSSAFGSDQVMREMYLAMEMQKPIVPLIVDDAPMPDDFRYILAKFQRHMIQPPLGSLVTRALADC